MPGFQFWLDLCRPVSRGAVTLRSADPAEPPSIVFNHLSAREDLADLVAGVRLARTLAHQPASARYLRGELTPGPDVATDAELEAFVRQRASTSYHPSGTCRMGADDGAVVDGEARVTGVQGLRVVDASIMPRVVTGNLNAPVMMMAEKVSDRIRGREPRRPSTAAYYTADV